MCWLVFAKSGTLLLLVDPLYIIDDSTIAEMAALQLTWQPLLSFVLDLLSLRISNRNWTELVRNGQKWSVYFFLIGHIIYIFKYHSTPLLKNL